MVADKHVDTNVDLSKVEKKPSMRELVEADVGRDIPVVEEKEEEKEAVVWNREARRKMAAWLARGGKQKQRSVRKNTNRRKK